MPCVHQICGSIGSVSPALKRVGVTHWHVGGWRGRVLSTEMFVLICIKIGLSGLWLCLMVLSGKSKRKPNRGRCLLGGYSRHKHKGQPPGKRQGTSFSAMISQQ